MSFGSLGSLVGFGILHGILSLGIILALAWTSTICRERFSLSRFSRWLLTTLWLMSTGVFLLLGLVGTGVMRVVASGSGGSLVSVLGFALGGGFSVGLFLFLLLLPFLVLTFRNSLYRPRFCRAFHLPGPERTEAGEQLPQHPAPSGPPEASSPEAGPAPSSETAARP
jgi:hypothetical protein